MSDRRTARPVSSSIRSLGALLAAAGLALTVAACGSSAATTPSTASAAPSTIPSATAPASPDVSPSPDPHGAPDLEAMLPDRIGGVTLSKVSLTGAQFFATGSPENQTELTTMLSGLGATVDDLRVAQAHDPQGALVFQEGIFQVKGADGPKLLDAWIASQQVAMNNNLKISEATVGGRTMTLLHDPTRQVGASTYAIAIGDAVWLVAADEQAILDEAVADMPPGS